MYDLKAEWGDMCIQPIYWHEQNLKSAGTTKNGDSIFKAMPPKPKDGRWTGYFVEVKFPGEPTKTFFDVVNNEFTVSTPGFTWP